VPSRKQRRRREKLQRHEYEYVIETEEGEEIVVETPREREKPRDGKSKDGVVRDRRGRELPKPSLGRVLKRGAIFAPLMFIFVMVTSDSTVGGTLAVTVMLLAFFLPFSYLVDVIVYRMLMRRRERGR
jgi:hypothetical protein